MLPTYKLIINPEDETGVESVAMVDLPAIERNFVAFNKETYQFKVQNEERRIVSGPLLIPDKPIYRKDDNLGEYNVMFDSQTVYQIVQKFFKQKNTGNVNEMHQRGKQPEGVYMFESFIIDKARGIQAPKGFEDLPQGTWFGSYKVEDDAMWQKVKSGEFQGFSVEGNFIYETLRKQDNWVDDLVLMVQNIV